MVKGFKKFAKGKRKGHLAWSKDDITIIRDDKPIDLTKPDRSGHLSWGVGDVEWTRKGKPIKEEAPVKPKTDLNYSEAPEEHHADHSIDGEHYEHQHAHRDTFSKAMDTAAYHYKDNSGALNKPLRQGAPGTERAKTHIPLMDKVTNHPTSEHMHVYRGFESGRVDFSKLKVGDVIHDKGFTGTSLHKRVAHGFSNQASLQHDHLGNRISVRQVAKIEVPKGSKGHHLDMQMNASHKESQPYPCSDEHEFLLKRGSHFQITGHSKMSEMHPDDNNYERHYHMIHMKLIKQDD